LFALDLRTFSRTEASTGVKESALYEQEEAPQELMEQEPPPPEEQRQAPPPQPEEIEITEDEELEDDVEFDDLESDENPVDDVIEDEGRIYEIVEEEPEFPGGYPAMYKFLSNNIKYPPMAKHANVQGKVYVQFVVETDGSITDVKVLRGIGSGCDKEAVRVVKMMPKWKPGKQQGRNVRVSFKLPVKYKLQ